MNDVLKEFPQLGPTIEAFTRSNFQDAERQALALRDESRRLKNRTLESLATGWAGAALTQQSRYQEAMEHLPAAIGSLTELGRHDLIARFQNYVAVVYEELGDFEAAFVAYDQALAGARATGQRELEGRILGNIGEAYVNLDRFDEAREPLKQASILLEDLGERALQGWVLWAQGRVVQKHGDVDAAREMFMRAIEITDRGLGVRGRAEARVGLGSLYSELGRHDEALALLEEALVLAQSVRNRREVFKTHLALSQAYERAGNLEKALENYKAFHQVRTEVYDEAARATTHLLKVETELSKERFEREIWRLRNVELATALERLEEQARQLVRLSVRDGLTGVFNRRHLDEQLPSELARARRTGQPISVAMIDLDNFKRINDSVGHSLGDRALQGVADVITGLLRQSDILARYGGEEFAIVFPDTGEEAAAAACERIRAAIEARDWTDVSPNLGVTASFGVAQANATCDAGSLLDEADARLYAAKAAGRNRVVAGTSQSCGHV